MQDKPKSNQFSAYAGGAVILAVIAYNVAVAPTIAPTAILVEQYEFQVYCPIDQHRTSSNLLTLLTNMGFNK